MMKERSKERMSELLMDELLSQLSERGNIRRMLGEMTGLPIASLIKDMVSEFEQVVEKYHRHSVQQSGEMPIEAVVHEETSLAAAGEESLPLAVRDSPALDQPVLLQEEASLREAMDHEAFEETRVVEPPVDEMVPSEPPIVEPEFDVSPSVQSSPPVPEVVEGHGIDTPPEHERDDMSVFRQKLEDLAKRVESEYLENLEKGTRRKGKTQTPRPKEEPVAGIVPAGDEPVPAKPAFVQEEGPVPARFRERGKISRIPYRIDSADFLYVHGVMRIPADDEQMEQPFMLEEKGIDGREFAFALDLDGLRFFLSKVNQNEMNVSRKGVMLLSKQESLQLRGVHESILNELRAHGMVLPVEFATVARGKDDLLRLAVRYHDDLNTSLNTLAKTKWWTLDLYVLDARLAQLFAGESAGKSERAGRERERVSFSVPVQQKKYDVKILEKILQKEKRLAESVHEELSTLADRSEVQSMVGLGSGSSDDWKLILKASYEVIGIGVQKLTRTVTDLQYRHILFEPLFSLSGDQEAFSFLKK